jgi:hypothetical protein
MVVHGIDAESDNLHITPVELGLDFGHVSQFGRADLGKVLRAGEEHAP